MKFRAAVLAVSTMLALGAGISTAGTAEAHSGCYINYDGTEAWASCASYNGKERMRVKIVCQNSSGARKTVYGDWVAYANDVSYVACPSGYHSVGESMQFSVG